MCDTLFADHTHSSTSRRCTRRRWWSATAPGWDAMRAALRARVRRAGEGGGGPRVENNGPMALWRRQLHVVVVIAQPPARLWISKGGAPAFLLHQPPGIDRSKMDVGLEDAAQLATEYEQLHGENETPVGELSSNHSCVWSGQLK